MIMMENQKSILGDSKDVAMHCKWRSPESCLSATKRVVTLAKKVQQACTYSSHYDRTRNGFSI